MGRVTSAGRVAVVAAVALAACKASRSEAPAGLGRLVHAGPIRALAASPDGAWLAFLESCRDARGQFLPPGTANCDLRAVPAAGGDAVRVASAVTTLPQGFAWSPVAPVLEALSEYGYESGRGTLVAWRPGAGARTLAPDVGYAGFGEDGTLGFITAGRLGVVPPGGEPFVVAQGPRFATFDLRPRGGGAAPADAVDGLARATYDAGGGLSELRLAGRALREVATGVTDYGFSPDGRRFAYVAAGRDGAALFVRPATFGAAGERVAGDVSRFAFSPDGRAVAFVAGTRPGRQGDLSLAADGRRPALLGKDVGELRWAARAPRLAWLEGYDPRIRAGALGVGGPGLAPRVVAPRVTDFDVSPDGAHVAYLEQTARGGFSVDLGLAAVDVVAGAKPATVARGVFGFAFSPDGRWLYYRTRCTRNGEACDVERVPAAGPGPGAGPQVIARGAKSFDFDPRDPERLLVGFARMDMVALDLAVWDHGKLVAVDQAAVPGTARFLPPDSRRVAYAVAAPKRQGVYVAELPR